MVGLFRGEGVEETDANYRRQPIRFGPAQSDDDGHSFRANLDEVRFPGYAERAATPVTWWALFDAAGRRVYADRPRRPVQYDAGEEPYFAAGKLRVVV